MGQAAWHHAQDQTSWHRSRRRRLPAQSYRLYPDPHSQTACRLATPRQGAPNTRLENYIQLHRAAPTTTGQNKTTLHFKVLQQTARAKTLAALMVGPCCKPSTIPRDDGLQTFPPPARSGF